MTPINLFEQIDISRNSNLLELFSLKKTKKGQVLVKQNKKESDLFVIRKGKFSVIDEQGKRITLAMLGPGNIVGEMSFLLDTPRSATVISTLDGQVYALSRKKLPELVEKKPVLSSQFLMGLCQLLTGRLRETDGMQNLLCGDEDFSKMEQVQKLAKELRSREKICNLDFDEPDLMEICEIRQVKKHYTVVGFSEKSNDLFLVKKGLFRIYSDPDSSVVLAEYGPGLMFGELSFIDGNTRSARIVAEEPGEILKLSRKVLEITLTKNPVMTARLLLSIGEFLAERLNLANLIIRLLSENDSI